MFQVAILLIAALKMSRWKVLFSSTLPTAHFCQNGQYAELSKAGKQHLFCVKGLDLSLVQFQELYGDDMEAGVVFLCGLLPNQARKCIYCRESIFLTWTDAKQTRVPFETQNLTFVVWTQFCFVTHIPNRHGSRVFNMSSISTIRRSLWDTFGIFPSLPL